MKNSINLGTHFCPPVIDAEAYAMLLSLSVRSILLPVGNTMYKIGQSAQESIEL